MNYSYIIRSKSLPSEQMLKAINDYCVKNKLKIEKSIVEDVTNKMHWNKRQLNKLINSDVKPGGCIVVYDVSQLARSTLQVLEILDLLVQKGINLHVVKFNKKYKAQKLYDTTEFLCFIKDIEIEFVTKRTTEALSRRRELGLPLGRPKGRKNKTRKLDKYKSEIKKYLDLGINKASIAKLVGCHAQTLYNYLEDVDFDKVKSDADSQNLTSVSRFSNEHHSETSEGVAES